MNFTTLPGAGASALLLALLTLNAAAGTLYVDLNSTNPVSPYSDWSTSATNIQVAINAATAGDTIWVTNGTYNTGGIVVKGGTLTNRVALTKAVTVQSVNGPDVTIIEGYQVPGTTNGPSALRCTWLTNGATLSGFQLTKGATTTGDAHGGGAYCWSSSATLSNCVIQGNSAVTFGGGVYQGTVLRCLLSNNAAPQLGGAANGATVVGSKIIGNTGSGAASCTLRNCLIQSNTPNGSVNGSAINCTFVQNGAALYSTAATNCIIWFNGTGGSASGHLVNCCYSPAYYFSSPTASLTLYPNFLSDSWHLAADSPCIGRGVTNGVTGSDLDGNPWGNPPSIGCVEWNPKPLIISQPRVMPASTPGLAVVKVETAGATPYCWWTKDGASIGDGGRYSGAHTTSLNVTGFNVADAGAYQVIVSNSFGVVTSAVVAASIACVDAANANSVSPYTDWIAAASAIQDAVDAAGPGTVVLVTNGVYAIGGRLVAGDMFNRVVLDKSITVICLNGPASTVIQGAWDPTLTNGPASVRCAWLADGAALGGFTLRNGSSITNGGGVWCAGLGLTESVIGCVITNCCAAGYGGGAYQGRLRDCQIVGNSSCTNGGGAASSFVDHSLVQSNTGAIGGGVYLGVARRSEILANTGSVAGGGAGPGTLLLGCPVALNCSPSYGGAYSATLYNCTVISNSVAAIGFCKVWNSILYFNPLVSDPVHGMTFQNVDGSSSCVNICSDVAGITNNPQLLDLWHIATTSPCRGVGLSFGNAGFGDIDGGSWGLAPAIGCDEPSDSALIGPLSIAVAGWPEVAAGGTMPLTATIGGRAARLQWDYGDGVTATNVSFSTAHAWTNAGDYSVTATVFNTDYPSGVAASVPVHVQPLVPPLLLSPVCSEPTFSMQLSAQPGVNYELQTATNLAAPVWKAIQSYYTPGGDITVMDTNATGTNRFYRLQIR
jgi:hypothetical protein